MRWTPDGGKSAFVVTNRNEDLITRDSHPTEIIPTSLRSARWGGFGFGGRADSPCFMVTRGMVRRSEALFL
jgi:hypothetical protein